MGDFVDESSFFFFFFFGLNFQNSVSGAAWDYYIKFMNLRLQPENIRNAVCFIALLIAGLADGVEEFDALKPLVPG